MQIWKAELLHQTGLMLGEGAIWHNGWKKFLFVDIEGMMVGAIDPVTKAIESRKLDKRIGTVVPATNGNLIVALQGSVEVLEFKTGKRQKLLDIESDKPMNRCNDGKCDAAGRLWIGTMHVDANLHEGALYCYDGSFKKVIENRSVSNGIGWSGDNHTMYYIDSFDYDVKAYDFDLTTGNISGERIAVKIEEPGCMPDGMTVDKDGMIWVAMWGGACVNRYDPHNGNLIGKVMVVAPHVTSCAFGGDNMQTLFITTAKQGLSKSQLNQYPLSGALFTVETDIKGAGAHFFKNDQVL
ncbi:SMP-30/gluconolactonase/LRE family protein [Mucilaginibacter pocheonensis]|uniref:Sugar lactone lactonase YvrE n=1 Tax=Mucilaginibacter pocheonensis TaxID=398050 RepID=A0ABU1TB44_9SPHI|nr:SMP-30/gluconolactonase/LRE family protein [Mucilaginibacter pocheonensis]MDR6942606.1 sugar lactone lactonase YvrE [Mucilaginibacter pocheonensis]